MAYNLESLITILEQILNPQQTRWIVDHNKPQLESLLEKSAYLQQTVENSSLHKIEWLERKIRDAAHKAEDFIESHMVDQILSTPGGASYTFSTPDLQQVMKKFDDIKEQVVELMKGETTTTDTSRSGKASSSSSSHDPSSKNVVVGVDEDLRQLSDRVMGMQSKLEIVPIVGMGGIGKTTLARKLYQDPSIVSHFQYAHAWATITQEYDMQAILLGLLGCIIGKELDQHLQKKSDELKDLLYRSLYGRRYMIVLDDIWSTEFWDEMRMYFPDNNNRSRILITTRESDVANYIDSSRSKQHEMQLLNESESWNLLRQEVFGEENCPAELEKIGRSIARDCGGLPLAIHVVGGLLSEANARQGFWASVASSVRDRVANDNDFSNILSLSYEHLPSHLRPCFLYMGAFPEDCEIKASRLIRLWVAEGFLRPSRDRSLEEEAEDCLKALVGRNLVSVRAVGYNGRAKSYGMHDLMRDLCYERATGQRFVHVNNREAGCPRHSIRRVSVHPSYRVRDIYASAEQMSLARSFLCTGRASPVVLSSAFFALRLLRVLHILDIEFARFPEEILRIVALRYLAVTYKYGELTSDLPELFNLQTLVINPGSYVSLPFEIVQMAELRHVVVHGDSFIVASSGGLGFNQGKLQTISTVYNPRDGFLHSIPNIRKLGIDDDMLSVYDLSHLQRLEKLKLSGRKAPLSPSALRLPNSLKKLSLAGYKLGREFMRYLAELPDLECLKLRDCEFEGGEMQEWDALEQEFSKLQYLLLERVKLVHWQADETNFPRLRHLVIRGCSALEEIPFGIGEIPTLQTIELDECSSSLVASAELIIEEQRDNGNDELQLRA